MLLRANAATPPLSPPPPPPPKHTHTPRPPHSSPKLSMKVSRKNGLSVNSEGCRLVGEDRTGYFAFL